MTYFKNKQSNQVDDLLVISKEKFGLNLFIRNQNESQGNYQEPLWQFIHIQSSFYSFIPQSNFMAIIDLHCLIQKWIKKKGGHLNSIIQTLLSGSLIHNLLLILSFDFLNNVFELNKISLISNNINIMNSEQIYAENQIVTDLYEELSPIEERSQSSVTQEQNDLHQEYFSFQHKEKYPASLTMTSLSQQTLKNILSIPIYFWIDSQISSFVIKSLEVFRIQLYLNSVIIFLPSVSQTAQMIQKYGYSNVYIITSLKQAQEVENTFSQEKIVRGIYCFCSQVPLYQTLKTQGSLGPKFIAGTDQLIELVQYLVKNISYYSQQDETMNFAPVQQYFGRADTIIKTFSAMLNQVTSKMQLIDEMEKLILKMGLDKSAYLQKVRQVFGGQQIEFQKLFNLYLEDSLIHVVITRLIKVMMHPSQIYCFQPIIKALFYGIKKISQIEKRSGFTCFKGGMITKKELQYFKDNIGAVIQNLGFMFCSNTSREATTFSANVKFIIYVYDSDSKLSGKSLGVVDLGTLGLSNLHQNQICFNPFNMFRILNVRKFECDYIYLQFAPSFPSQESLYRLYQQNVISVSGIGDVLQERGQNLQGSEQYWEIYKKISVNQSDLILSLKKIAMVCVNKGELGKALKAYGKIQKMGLTSDQRALNNYNLAKVYENLGQFQKSIYYYKQYYHYKQSLGYVTWKMHVQMGFIYCKMGEYQKSMELMNLAQQTVRTNYSVHSLSYAIIMNCMGLLYDQILHYNRSLQFYYRAEEIKRIKLSVNHPSYAATLSNIALVYKNIGDYNKSLQYLNRCRQIEKNTIGVLHHQYIGTVNNIALIYNLIFKYDDSIQILSECQFNISKTFGTYHRSYLTTLHNIGVTYSKKGQYEKSVQLFKRCQEIIIKTLGFGNPFYMNNLINIGECYKNGGEFQKSIQIYMKSKTKIVKQLGVFHLFHVNVLRKLSECYTTMGQEKNGRFYLEKAKVIESKIKPQQRANGK